MPQLLPAPWFLVFIITWVIFILVAPKKILTHLFLNEPTPTTTKTSKHSWIWLW
uniref:ATP synthase complex subunit 8 n=1 Tax=Nanorana taihangnica TaxID=586025 RepID=A0A059XV04_NANTA|nr:ATP synthase F0 subunit 8 [Nanorana taihangnica]AIA26328.1 ATP synthase F0 subunit 8 [Nanorana taihangnica]